MKRRSKEKKLDRYQRHERLSAITNFISQFDYRTATREGIGKFEELAGEQNRLMREEVSVLTRFARMKRWKVHFGWSQGQKSTMWKYDGTIASVGGKPWSKVLVHHQLTGVYPKSFRMVEWRECAPPRNDCWKLQRPIFETGNGNYLFFREP